VYYQHAYGLAAVEIYLISSLREEPIYGDIGSGRQRSTFVRGADTIVLPPNSVQMLTAVNNTNYGPAGLPTIRTQSTIQGNGSRIQRVKTAPRFQIMSVARTGRLTLQKATVTGSGDDAISNHGGTLNINSSTIQATPIVASRIPFPRLSHPVTKIVPAKTPSSAAMYQEIPAAVSGPFIQLVSPLRTAPLQTIKATV
jgi:hypothetical protein